MDRECRRSGSAWRQSRSGRSGGWRPGPRRCRRGSTRRRECGLASGDRSGRLRAHIQAKNEDEPRIPCQGQKGKTSINPDSPNFRYSGYIEHPVGDARGSQRDAMTEARADVSTSLTGTGHCPTGITRLFLEHQPQGLWRDPALRKAKRDGCFTFWSFLAAGRRLVRARPGLDPGLWRHGAGAGPSRPKPPVGQRSCAGNRARLPSRPATICQRHRQSQRSTSGVSRWNSCYPASSGTPAR